MLNNKRKCVIHEIILVKLQVVSYLYENNYTIVDVTVDVLSDVEDLYIS